MILQAMVHQIISFIQQHPYLSVFFGIAFFPEIEVIIGLLILLSFVPVK